MQHHWFPLFLFSSDFTRHRGLLGCNTGHCLRLTSCSLGSSSSIVCPVPCALASHLPLTLADIHFQYNGGLFALLVLCFCFFQEVWLRRRIACEDVRRAHPQKLLCCPSPRTTVFSFAVGLCWALQWGFAGLCSCLFFWWTTGKGVSNNLFFYPT